nr:hypothetical protein [Parafrankia sp. EUN1f]
MVTHHGEAERAAVTALAVAGADGLHRRRRPARNPEAVVVLAARAQPVERGVDVVLLDGEDRAVQLRHLGEQRADLGLGGVPEAAVGAEVDEDAAAARVAGELRREA